MSDNNKANLSGEILGDFKFSHKIKGEAFYEFELGTSRASGVLDIIKCQISERLMLDDFNDSVMVRGEFRSYNVDVKSKKKLSLLVFVKEIFPITQNVENQNELTLNGFIVSKPILRKTPNGFNIADVFIAVNANYRKSYYIPCIFWGRNAKYAAGLEVGRNIKLNGRMQSRRYDKALENGVIEIRTAYEVSVTTFEVINV